MLASDFGPPLRPKGLAKEEQRSLPPPDALSDWKAWPNTTSNSDPRLRPRIHRTPTYSSSPTSAIRADWDQPTGDARSVKTRKRMEQVRQGAQVDRDTEDCTMHTCRTVTDRTCQKGALQPSSHARIKQCCGRRRLSDSVVGAINSHTRQTQ